MNDYFEARLTNGITYNFGRMCNYIDYTDTNMCIFQRVSDDGAETLALVPYIQLAIINRRYDTSSMQSSPVTSSQEVIDV